MTVAGVTYELHAFPQRPGMVKMRIVSPDLGRLFATLEAGDEVKYSPWKCFAMLQKGIQRGIGSSEPYIGMPMPVETLVKGNGREAVPAIGVRTPYELLMLSFADAKQLSDLLSEEPLIITERGDGSGIIRITLMVETPTPPNSNGPYYPGLEADTFFIRCRNVVELMGWLLQL
jgi:hypothetical protein